MYKGARRLCIISKVAPPMAIPPARSATSSTFLVALLFLVLIHSSYSAENRTIDDTHGDSVSGALPSYSGPWNVGQLCSDCSANPSPPDTFMSSWHDVTTQPDPNDGAPNAVTLSFQGACFRNRSGYLIIRTESQAPPYGYIVSWSNQLYHNTPPLLAVTSALN